MVNSYAEKRESESEEKLTLAYLNAMWTIQFLGGKNPPKLDDYLNKKQHKKEMTNEQMLNQVKVLNNLFGGDINIE